MTIEIAAGIRTEVRSNTNFDSRLVLGHVSVVRNADIVIDVRVHFHRRDGGQVRDGANVAHTTQNWTSDREFRHWINSCRALLETRLGERIWLVPSAEWGVKVTHPGACHIPAVKCGLRVIPVDAGQRKHLWLDCYRVSPNYCPPTPAATATAPIFTSNMSGRNLGASRNYGQVVNVDILSCAMPGTESHFQEVVVHEFYHFLGFEHVAYNTPACPVGGNINGQACYGGTPRQRESLGGMGRRVEAWMYRPWQRALDRHVAWRVPWMATMTRPSPRRVSVPRALGVPGGVPALDGGV